MINSSKPVELLTDAPRVHSQNKRKINLLVYDPTGSRTTKTANWDSLSKMLATVEPNHLPMPAWFKDIDAVHAECDRKGLPYAPGRRHEYQVSENFNKVRW